ncbi:SDR family NAD(P)-dependent oxidoreductase [Microbacterium betulae]|uniref:SDR family NAD(P)-dependent oxidoreductase n=1 Tax=Microbacterium betulae TaxID=2981139 RepID=A0AA97FHZ8_9MICO|nr:SDR family NAD(P)-dependent oxidoreductase [Microbacterium sp. AB]WOF23573.1 SDR family NAD(P)-dependent oxidoreductase [Microbacterium sp. AB]
MRTIVITGASDGIGAAAADLLAGGDDRLILVGRSPAKTKAVAERVGAEHRIADFERLDEVRDLAAALLASCERIDVLANNAGGIFSGPTRTVDGFEKTFQINHLAPFLLTNLLIDRLVDSRAAVVNTSSVAARLFGRIDLDDLETWDAFRPNRAYGNAKLANILFTRALHERFHDRGLSTVAFHPGNVATSFASDTTSPLRWIYHGFLKRFLISPERGGATLASFIAGEPGADWASGEYYDENRRIGRTNAQAYDPEIVREHGERSARMLGVRW